jgi:alpha-galactosidase
LTSLRLKFYLFRMNLRLLSILILLVSINLRAADALDYSSFILTPPAPATPRINGPTIFGVRPDAPFLYTIPATGDRPMTFSVENLPDGLSLNSANGQITGSLGKEGEYTVVFHAKNDKGDAKKKFRIEVGEKIALTPPMGWNSWNCWAWTVSQDKVLRSARAMVSSGLINHGWTYVNIDDTWQGQRDGKTHALQGGDNFHDMKGLCDEIHKMGLKAGIYSSPWVTTYGSRAGSSSDNPDGSWSQALANESNHHPGKYSFIQVDANQWAVWGFDYLKYDWDTVDVFNTMQMSKALRKTGRDFVFSLSNTAPFEHAADWARWANNWRTTSDIRDAWVTTGEKWQFGVSEIGFNQDRWAPYSGPGHWNDPDMLVVGYVGWGNLHPAHLTPDEQYTHISLWCMLAAPLLIGCNLDQLDPFTLNLLSNDEVLAVDQDALGKQAVRMATSGSVDVYVKDLEDGGKAVGFFNRDSSAQTINFNKLGSIGLNGSHHVRDLWRQQDLPDVRDVIQVTIPAHGVELYKFTAAE